MVFNLTKITPSCRVFNFHKIITFDTEALRFNDDTFNEFSLLVKELKETVEDYDYEDLYEIQKFYNIDFYDGEKHYYSENIDDVIPLLLMFKQKYKKISLFAHNIKYDIRILNLIPYLSANYFLGLPYSLKMMDNVFYTKFVSKNNEYIIQIMDSRNYFKTSLNNIAKMFNMNKTDITEYDLPADEWNKQLQIDGEERVKTDTEILYVALKAFSEMPFNFGITLASTSLNTFRKNYLKKTIYFPDELMENALLSYRGGLVLPYQLAINEKLYSYDINSLYPKVMRDNPYSVKYNKEITDYRWIYDDIKNNAYNYLVKVRYSGNGYSPIMDKYDNQLMPFLENELWITGNELLALYENNFNILILEAHTFYNDFIFKEFVDDFYNKRLESKTAYEKEFFKTILNSLYGKFGQHKAHSEFMKIDEIENEMVKYTLMNTHNQHIMIDGTMYNKYGSIITTTKESEIRYNPLIASEVTANARLLNYEYSKIFGFENLFYTDTDSFFVKNRRTILEGNELGKLKVEKEGIFNIYAPKDYSYYGKCNKKDCNICKDGDGLHFTIKGIRDTLSLYGHSYENKRWSGIKYPLNNNMYIDKRIQYINRVNKKMRYVNGIGYEWRNKEEYNKYAGIRPKITISGLP